jgi:putative ABC transport system substrate-binding protein
VQAVGIAETNDNELESALDTALAGRPQALISAVASGSIIPATNTSAVTNMMSFALEHALPTASSRVVITALDGLLFYGPDLAALYRRAGSCHVDRILRGAKAEDLSLLIAGD